MEDVAIQAVCRYIIGMMARFKVRKNPTGTHPPRYDVITEESALFNSIEDVLFFKDRSAYVVIAGIDGWEYVSGNDYSIAIAYDGSRPNVKYTELPIPNIEQSQKATVEAVRSDGGYISYQWVDPNQVVRVVTQQRSYVHDFNGYLYVNVTYRITDTPKEHNQLPIVMADVITQLISNYTMYNIRTQGRMPRFFNAIDDGHLTLVTNDGFIIGEEDYPTLKRAIALINKQGGGFLDKNTFCTTVAYFNYVMWYRI